MAINALSDALGTTPSLVRGMTGKGTMKERADYGREKLPEIMQGASEAEFEAEKTKFDIQQGQIKREAEAEGALAAQSRQAASDLDAGTREYQEFQAPQIKASDYAANSGLRLLSALLIGGIGGSSAKAQLMAIREMQDAEDKNQRESFANAKLKFDEAEKTRQSHNSMLKDRFERMLNLLSKDRNAAMVEAKLIEGQVNNGLIAAQLRMGNFNKAYEYFTKGIDASNKMEEDFAKKIAEFEQKKALKAAPSGARIGGGGGGGGGGKATQQRFIVQRSINSLGGVASAVEAIKELPAGTTIGVLSNLQTKDGLVNYLRNTVGRKVSSNEAEMMNTLFTGIGRNLAAIEASGVATGLTVLANQMQSGTYIQEGIDTPEKVAIKLADIRRIATENIRPAIEAGLMAEDQARTAQELVDRIEKAIPFTVVDVIRAARKPGKETIETQTGRTVTGKNKPTFTEEDQQRMDELERKQRNAR